MNNTRDLSLQKIEKEEVNDQPITVTDNKEDQQLGVAKYSRLFPSKLSTKGFVELYVLFLMKNDKSYYGKELVDEISSSFGSAWTPSHGLMYPVLRKLESDGFLEGNWEDEDKKSKRIYKITPLGKIRLEEELKAKKSMFVDSYNMMVTVLTELYDYKLNQN